MVMRCEGEMRRTREVRVKFEPSRVQRQCLSAAYEHVVPIVRRPVRFAKNSSEAVQAIALQRAGGGRAW